MNEHSSKVKTAMGRLGSACFGAAAVFISSPVLLTPNHGMWEITEAILNGMLFVLLGVVTAAVMNPGTRLVLGMLVAFFEFTSCTAMR